ncbi:Mt2 [Trypoxylus dichotomus]
MRVLELFSGIGGMHFALKESGVAGEIVAAIDINTTANLVLKNQICVIPHQFGIPNTRHRYYCLAKKLPRKFSFELGPIENSTKLFDTSKRSSSISEFLENDLDVVPYLLPEKVLRKYAAILDICFSHSVRSCCFTKAYDPDSEEFVYQLRKLNLRFFTPTEVARLMCFPGNFNFPKISNKQKYMLLGNSVNIKVVAELIKLLNKILAKICRLTVYVVECPYCC